MLGLDGKRVVAGDQRCKLFYSLLHFCRRMSLWCHSWLCVRSVLKNTLIREMSIQARSCTVEADSGSQSVLFEESVQSNVLPISST